jgi:hypothetical protein
LQDDWGMVVLELFFVGQIMFFSICLAIYFNIMPENILPEFMPNLRAEKYLEECW